LYATAEVLAVTLPISIAGAATPNTKPTKPFSVLSIILFSRDTVKSIINNDRFEIVLQL